MTPSEIEPATFRLVAQCLNQLRHRVPHTAVYGSRYVPRYSEQRLFEEIFAQINTSRVTPWAPAETQLNLRIKSGFSARLLARNEPECANKL